VKVREALASSSERLAAARVESPRVDAETLVAHVLGVRRSELALAPARVLGDEELATLEALVARREAREPLAYVLGEWGFRRLTLQVDRRVLVPRPETEIVVERCLDRLVGVAEPRALDVGTGSGAIALAIVDEHAGARVTALDASPGALEVARANAERTGLALELCEWDLFDGLPEGPWDLVVSNPPYVRPDEIGSLAPEVREWEPREALVGVGATAAIVRGASNVLRPGGALVLEVADGSAWDVAELLADCGYADLRMTRDLTDRERVVEGVRT
jgi:release factor glutamine methyltransferase